MGTPPPSAHAASVRPWPLITHPRVLALQALALRHPIATFLVLAYGLGWAWFLVPLLGRGGFGLLPIDPPVQPFILLASIAGLAPAAFIVTALTRGRAGLRDLAGRYLQWRVGIWWYALALFGLLLAFVLGVSLLRGGAPLALLVRHWPLLLAAYLPQLLIGALLINLWEETAWTAFLTERLQRRIGPLLASVAVAPAFAAIHLPLLFIAGGLSDTKIPPSEYLLYVLYLGVFTIPMRVLLTWIYNSTGRSLLVVALFHSSVDATAGAVISPTLAPGVNLLWVYAVVALGAAAVIVATRGQLAYHREAADTVPMVPVGGAGKSS